MHKQAARHTQKCVGRAFINGINTAEQVPQGGTRYARPPPQQAAGY